MRGEEHDLGENGPYELGGLIGEGQEIARNIRNAQVMMIEACFGRPLADLVEHPEVVAAFAGDPDPNARCHVLTFFAYYAPQEESRGRLIAALGSDPACDVRIVAACLLGEMFGSTGDLDLLERLKAVARDEREDPEVRKSAYLSVTRIDRDDNFIDPDSFDLATDADWDFFDRVVPLHDSPGVVSGPANPQGVANPNRPITDPGFRRAHDEPGMN